MIKVIDNVAVVVENLTEGVKWYSDILGLKNKFTEESIQWAEMDAGGRSTLALKTSGKPQICLEVEDMDAEMERLKGLGVVFHDVMELPMGLGRVTSFDDPWGNEIGFYEASKK